MTTYHMQISKSEARSLVKGDKLPAWGKERLVAREGNHYWLKRETSRVTGREIWTIRQTDWQLENGNAVLRG